MATYALFLGPPHGEALRSKKHRERHPDAVLGLDAQAVAALGIERDEFASSARTGVALDSLRTELEQRISKWRQEATAAVLSQGHRSQLEPWIDAMVTSQVDADPRIAHAGSLLDLVLRAQAGEGTIIYWAD